MLNSKLFDEKSFYSAFIKDLEGCKEEVIIESPYITASRMRMLKPIFERLINRGIRIYFITRDPKEHDESMEIQSEEEIRYCEILGIQVLLCVGNHHRKLAILDRRMLWEGSLNILSQTHSREIMRKIDDKKTAEEMFQFLRLDRFI